MSAALLTVRDLQVHFRVPGKGMFAHHRTLKAVDGVDFELQPGETLGVVSADGTAHRVARTRSAQLESLEEELRVALGTKVDLRQTAKGRGRVVIHFKNHSEFERLQSLLLGTELPAAKAA